MPTKHMFEDPSLNVTNVLFVFSCRVVFKFKGSKKSNNGTDVNAGQIPQLLYRYRKILTMEFT